MVRRAAFGAQSTSVSRRARASLARRRMSQERVLELEIFLFELPKVTFSGPREFERLLYVYSYKAGPVIISPNSVTARGKPKRRDGARDLSSKFLGRRRHGT